ncbi:MAG TPA: methyltransferase domain-containing protein [Pseudolabrys sp.]|nr:methyltransferase domain-containing protein [Pseudolabrys sp.]
MQLQPIYLSSGNLIADRRFEWARDREAKGDLAGAADLLQQALELAPGYASAWFALGELREKLGDRAGAIAAFEQARAADPEDRHGAALHLMRLGAHPAAAMPEGYIRALFDAYASGFDRALTEGLSYRAPELLFEAVQAAHAGTRMKFGSVLDLGCGTGLAALPFRAFSDWMVGVDISAAMLAQARSKGLYDRLIESAAMAFLDGEARIAARYHLVLAADVFMYFDDLVPVIDAAARVLDPRGMLAFSVETHAGNGVLLRETLRYAHGRAHVESALAAAGLRTVSLESASTRTEKGSPVPGLIVAAAH